MDWKKLQKQQHTVARVLQHAIKRDELAHAYLLEGAAGTGKGETALLVAQTLFCESPVEGEPCLSCRNCRRIASGNHPDVIRIRAGEGAQSIKKNQIALLLKEFSYRGAESSRKIFIIEDADKLTVQAENSLLKFIEEPHPGTLALLTTDHVHQLLDTIISRCQVLSFIPLSDQAVAEQLEKDDQPRRLARPAAQLTHDFNEAQKLCHDEWFAKARSQVLQLTQRLGNTAKPVLPFIYEKFIPEFDDAQKLAVGLDLLLFWYKDLLSFQTGRPEQVIYEDQSEALNAQMIRISPDQTIQAMTLIFEAGKQLDAHVNGLSVMERLVIKLGGIYSA
ncbi:DNA polymerase III subunit delta' [Sporolactobacillus sp. THM19-2]|nr:DNA polymerase III subunit delta' [Sporolactobacillus sp. THM19-2]